MKRWWFGWCALGWLACTGGGGSGSSSAGGNGSSSSSSSGSGGVSSSEGAASSGATSRAASSLSAASSGAAGSCGAGKWDSYWDNACGSGQDTTVSCQDAPGTCETAGSVCGCDGAVHDSECAARLAGVDVSDVGGCAAPAGKFACGAHFCSGAQYCVHTGDLQGMPDNFLCTNLPSGCGGTPSCDCVKNAQCGTESMLGSAGTCAVTGIGVTNRCPDARFD